MNDVPASEKHRIDEIIKCLQRENIRIEDLIEADYPAIALHSNGTIIATSQEALDIFGYSSEDITYMNAWHLFPQESIKTIMQNQLNHSEEAYQVMAKRKDGSLFPVELKPNEFMLQQEVIRSVSFRKLD